MIIIMIMVKIMITIIIVIMVMLMLMAMVLRHVAMVEKFLDDNKPKTSLKKQIRTASNFILFNFI